MNHAIVTSRRFFNEHRLDEVIREINTRRFNGVFKVTKFNDVYWEVEHPTSEWRHHLGITVDGRRRLHLRRGIGGEFNGWLQFVFQEEIAAAFNGRCGDDGVDEMWAPEPNKYPTFFSYYDALNAHWKDEDGRLAPEKQKFLDGFFSKLVSRLPDDLMPFIRAES